ncbi:MAG: hypothetical protein IJC02_13215 [Lachnospiraceae bacterium]|nr:hypothetical protein [Lachnospiraceae bacterium]MBQ6995927.1 hypothetical protein [Lachnospiraceae bacterium]
MKKFYEALKGYIQDLKSGEKKFSKDGMLIVFFSGLLIYVILLPTNNNSSYEIGKQEEKKLENSVKDHNVVQEMDYQNKLEEELEDFLSQVKGIGEVEVLIYLNTTQEYVVEKDIPSHQVISQDGNGKSSEENKEEDTVYTVNESGEQVPFISQTRHPEIEGVVIAADGAGQENIRIQIIKTIMALYGVDANKIDVLERKKT